jgi:hypothetical protein
MIDNNSKSYYYNMVMEGGNHYKDHQLWLEENYKISLFNNSKHTQIVLLDH